MELEELQATWAQLGQELDKQKKLTHKIIVEMTQQRYSRKFDKIAVYEIVGSIICLLAAGYILIHFDRLDTWYLQLCGALGIVILVILPVLILWSLHTIRNVNVANSDYKDVLIRFTREKNRLLLLQRLNIYISFLFMIISLPIFSMILKGKDLFVDYKVWWWYLPIMAVFLFFFTRWGYGCYKSVTNSAEDILNELE
ncbi:hypothetical protein FK220_011125 [Flavobacteriaceae bacterium TP-CH-4]|uniref:Uncharacterized protein n=1 Tax=Pelagihabitans pacificus TaxID=2696054 RepID=A0A967E6R7_9FLAO|nr:hypothetical protein [Pelagihabitans pacificus]NHF59895.1 hypothetical protein [Pelagihabitans pacificus]